MRKIVIACLAFIMSAGLARLATSAESEKTVTGSLRDMYCDSVLGAHGPGHAQCALKCARKGIPVGLEEKGTDKVYILLPPKNEQPMPESVVNNMEKEVTVTGKEYSKGGVTFLTVDLVK
jgi:hypothetical protein